MTGIDVYGRSSPDDPLSASFEIDPDQIAAWFGAHRLPVRLRPGEIPRPRVAVVRFQPRR